MKRMVLIVIISAFFLYGCKASEDSSSGTTYDEMISKYDLLTVAELWTAYSNSNADYDGTYLLVKGVLHSVGTNSVILMDSDSGKAVTCSFETSIDLTDLQNVLDNNSSSDDEDTVTIGGINHYGDDNPYLESCDYFYINSDA